MTLGGYGGQEEGGGQKMTLTEVTGQLELLLESACCTTSGNTISTNRVVSNVSPELICFSNQLINYCTVKVLYFVDDNGNEVLSLGSMVKVSEETIRKILCRDSLNAEEYVKFQVKCQTGCLYLIKLKFPNTNRMKSLLSHL